MPDCEAGELVFDFASTVQDKIQPNGVYIIAIVIRKPEVKIILGRCVCVCVLVGAFYTEISHKEID
jgi:hypothetical protein